MNVKTVVARGQNDDRADPRAHDGTRRRLLAATALSFLSAHGVAAPADGIDAVVWMKALMLPKGTTHPPAWSFIDALPVRWKSAAPVAASPADRREGLPQMREGSFELLVGGKPSFTAPAKAVSGRWSVQLFGSAAGVSEVRWSPAAMVEDLDDGLGGLEAAGFKMRQVCTSPYVSSNTLVFRIARPDSLVATLVREFSSGSGGRIVYLSLRYTRERVAKAMCE